jgi:hypothetical protein
LNELGIDSHSIRITPNGALQHVLHAQFLADLRQLCRRVFIVHYRGACDHAHPARVEVTQLRDHFFCKAIAEIFLAWIPGEVLKRQNCQHNPARRDFVPLSRVRKLHVR